MDIVDLLHGIRDIIHGPVRDQKRGEPISPCESRVRIVQNHNRGLLSGPSLRKDGAAIEIPKTEQEDETHAEHHSADRKQKPKPPLPPSLPKIPVADSEHPRHKPVDLRLPKELQGLLSEDAKLRGAQLLIAAKIRTFHRLRPNIRREKLPPPLLPLFAPL